jgi:hypothetical protein
MRTFKEVIREGLYKYWHSAECPNATHQVNALLWASIARWLPVKPKVRQFAKIQIVDFSRGIAVTAYDDRGMALSP